MVSKGNSSTADESSMLESDADGPGSSTVQPSSSGVQERHTSKPCTCLFQRNEHGSGRCGRMHTLENARLSGKVNRRKTRIRNEEWAVLRLHAQ